MRLKSKYHVLENRYPAFPLSAPLAGRLLQRLFRASNADHGADRPAAIHGISQSPAITNSRYPIPYTIAGSPSEALHTAPGAAAQPDERAGQQPLFPAAAWKG